jgi:GNAT superfamily N-acetyltransferase
MDVREADTAWEVDQVRRLFGAFLAWHRERHVEDRALVDSYFDADAWQAELDGLPGAYAAPDGGLLVCWEAEMAIGCVAFRRLDEDSCEMKRMFVESMARGRGAGRALAEAVIAQARQAGYRFMYLDTSIRQPEAIALYRSLGFVDVEPYYDVSPALVDWLTFLRLDL